VASNLYRILVFFPTYNEAGNVKQLIQSILSFLPNTDILVIDDASPDNTGKVLDELAQSLHCLKVLHRQEKLGIGTAHKASMRYAVDHCYDILITMDADFSHNPKYLPQFLAHLSKVSFVTGSRYTEGGGCDYEIYRFLMSRLANIVVKVTLGLGLEENTTSYRGFRVSLLKQMKFDKIKSEGYSFFVESLFRVSRLTNELAEFPIHFENRRSGVSKISKVEILKAAITVFKLFAERLFERLNA
jgi:dolichol-phosphate mannosyltransferase